MGVACLALLAACFFAPKVKLAPDVKAWYDIHSPVMMDEMPWWTETGAIMSEAKYFKSLDTDRQHEYMAWFWKIRPIEAKQTFDARIEFARVFLRDEHRVGINTSRGYFCVLVGYPDQIDYIYDWELNQSFPRKTGDINGAVFQIWTYQHEGRIFRICFEYLIHCWRLSPISTMGLSDAAEVVRIGKLVYSIDPDAWDEWVKVRGW